MENSNDYIKPQQEGLSGGTHVPSGSNKTKNPNRILLMAGLNPGRIVHIVDLGTHMESYNNQPEEPKRKIKVVFEHSHLKQKYFLEDDKVSPAITSKEVTYIYSDRSWIKGLIDTCEGRVLSVQEAQTYDLSKLLGRIIGVNLVHQEVKARTHSYEKITSIAPWNDQVSRMPDTWAPEMEYHYFYIDFSPSGEVIGQNFTSTVFAKLPYSYRKALMESEEGKEYKARGGKFADKEDNNNQSQQGVQQQQQQQQYQQYQQAAAPQPNAAPQQVGGMPKSPDGNSVLQMIATDFSYDQYLASGWDANNLVAKGKAQWVALAPQQAPAPQGPSGPTAPAVQQAPAQQFQQNQNTAQGFKAGAADDDLPF